MWPLPTKEEVFNQVKLGCPRSSARPSGPIRALCLLAVAAVLALLFVQFGRSSNHPLYKWYSGRDCNGLRAGSSCANLTPMREPKLESLQTSLGWVATLERGKQKVTSQGFQDGILDSIFNVIRPENMFYVELGFGYVGKDLDRNAVEKAYANSPTNTFNLWKQGWRGRLFDPKIEHPGIGLYKETITGENVARVFAAHRVPHSVDYVSVDIDSVDYWVLRGILAADSPYRPRVISVEYNPNFPVQSTLACDPDWQPWAEDFVYGTSVGAVLDLSEAAGYQPVYIEEAMDLFLIRSDILQASGARGYTTQELAAKWSLPKAMHSRQCDRVNTTRFVDVRTFRETNGNMLLARRDGLLELRRVQKLYNISLCA